MMSRCASPASQRGAYQGEPVVDDLVVDLELRVADLLGSVEELRDEQVLALRRELDDAVRGGGEDAVIAEQPQGVVLVLHQPPHGRERRLVLEAAVDHRSTELVPAVGADVAHRVELPEQLRVGIAGDGDEQRRRSARAGEADRPDVEDGQPELVPHRPTDRRLLGTRSARMCRKAWL